MNVAHFPVARSLGTIDVQGLAGPRTYARGVEYARSGRVQLSVAAGGELAATVAGTSAYTARLAFGPAGLDHTCSCPVGAEGRFCKHLVAVAVAAGTTPPPDDRAAGHDWTARAHAVLDEVERVLAAGGTADVLRFCARADACLREGASSIGDQEALGVLSGRLDGLRRRAMRRSG